MCFYGESELRSILFGFQRTRAGCQGRFSAFPGVCVGLGADSAAVGTAASRSQLDAPSQLHARLHPGSRWQGGPAAGEMITQQMAQGLSDQENVFWGFRQEP